MKWSLGSLTPIGVKIITGLAMILTPLVVYIVAMWIKDWLSGDDK